MSESKKTLSEELSQIFDEIERYEEPDSEVSQIPKLKVQGTGKFFNKHLNVLQKIMNEYDKDYVEQTQGLMRKKIKQTKRADIKDDTVDDPGFLEWRKEKKEEKHLTYLI
jgi:CRISPR/Cas system-associated protein Cas10 (large subunit of type III CRISPR-Cas system)